MMIIQMNDHCTSLDVARVCDQQERQGYMVRIVPRSSGSCIVVDVTGDAAGNAAADLPGVRSVSRTKSSYPLASREIFDVSHPVDWRRESGSAAERSQSWPDHARWKHARSFWRQRRAKGVGSFRAQGRSFQASVQSLLLPGSRERGHCSSHGGAASHGSSHRH